MAVPSNTKLRISYKGHDKITHSILCYLNLLQNYNSLLQAVAPKSEKITSSNGSQRRSLETAVPASQETLEIKMFGITTFTESETLEVGPAICFLIILQVIPMHDEGPQFLFCTSLLATLPR